MNISDLFQLSDAEMACIEPHYLHQSNRLRWRDAPAAYDPHKMLYSRWKRWSEKGFFAHPTSLGVPFGGSMEIDK